MQQKEIQEKVYKGLSSEILQNPPRWEKDLQKGGKKQMGLEGGGEEGLTKWSMLQEAPKLDQGGGMKALLQEKKTPKSGHPMQLTDLKAKML